MKKPESKKCLWGMFLIIAMIVCIITNIELCNTTAAFDALSSQNAKIYTPMIDVTRSLNGKIVTICSVQNSQHLCVDEDFSDAPTVCNGYYASADTASRSVFTVRCTSDGWAGLKAHNGNWLTSRMDISGNPVCATAAELLSWECFRIYRKGDSYYIKSRVNNKWLSVRSDLSNAPVQACAHSASEGEQFLVQVVSIAAGVSSDSLAKSKPYA